MSESAKVGAQVLMFFIGAFGFIPFIGYEYMSPRVRKGYVVFALTWAAIWLLPPLFSIWIAGVL